LLVIAIPYYTSEHWFSKLCPLGTMVAGIPWVLWNPVDPETGERLLASNPPGLLFATKIILLSGFILLFVCKRPAECVLRGVVGWGLWAEGVSACELQEPRDEQDKVGAE
jgi:hypothetical protein